MCNSKKTFVILAVTVCLGAVMAGCSVEARKARHQARADKYFDAGRYPEAEIEYLNVLKADRLNPHAIGRLGLIYYEEGRLARAYSLLVKARELEPDNLELRLKTGLIYLATGNAKEARDEANAILERSPKFPKAPLLLAQSARTTKDADTIRQRLEELSRQTGDSAWLELGLGTLDVGVGDPKQAGTRFKQALDLDPKSGAAYFALASLYWVENDVTNAEFAFKTAAELSPPRSFHRLRYADFKIKTGHVEEGKQILKEMTKATPDYLPAWIALAEIALAQRHYEDCALLINQALLQDPNNYDALMLGAGLKLAKGETDKAIAEYERLNAAFKSSPQILFQLGQACLLKGDASKALKSFNEAVARDPNFDDALLQQAQLNIQRDNTEAAIASLTQLIKRRPQLPSAYLLLANAYAGRGNFDDALATCRRLETRYPKNPQVQLLIGGLLLKQGQKDEARKAFDHALELSPEFLPAFEQLLNLDLADHQYDPALQRVQAAIEKAPKSAELRALLARVFLAREDSDSAEQALQKAIELDVNYRPAYFMLANLYVSTKKNEQALRKVNEMVAKNPRDLGALMLMGMIQSDQRDYTAARATYEKLLAINPNFAPALNNVAYIYSEKLGLPDKAYEAARKAQDLSPNNPYSGDTLGWVLFRRHEYPWALSILQASADKLPDEPEVQFHLGMTYYMMDDASRASKALNRALASTKDFPGKTEASRRLSLLSLDSDKAGPEMVATLEKWIAEQPDDPVALSRLAAIYERQGFPEKAAQAYEQALKQNPNNVTLLLNLALLYSEHLNKPQKALDLAKDAYKRAPDDADISCALGRLAFAAGDCKWALSLLEKSAQKKPEDPELLYDLAMAYYSAGRVSDAETTMHSALQSKAPFTRENAARQFLELITLPADPAKALQEEAKLQQILQADPANVPAWMAAAAASEQRGDARATAAGYEQVLKRYPDFTPAIKRLAILDTEKLLDDPRAYDLAMKARGALPDDPEIAKVLGILLYRRGDFRGAARFLTESSQKTTSDAINFYYLGMACSQLKEDKQSKDALQRALALNLPTELAEAAKRVLASLK